jgi:signal transduction histidine kinase
MLIETSAPRILYQASDLAANPKILIADDDPQNLKALDAILAAPDREIVQARSGWEVLSRARQNDFAVVVLDMRMPDLDGLQVAARMKADQRTSRIPVVFITAYGADELQIASGCAAGVIDYVFKPINPKLLRAKIDILIDLYRKTGEIRRLAEQEKRLLVENLRIQKEKIAAEQRLRYREEHQSLVLQSLPIALYTANSGPGLRRLRFTNDSIRRLSGFSSSDFLRQPNLWEARLNPEEHGRVIQAFANIEKAGSASVEYRWRCADGTEKHVFDHAVLSEFRDGRRELFGFWLDVSDRKSLETDLLHASKLEAVGRLTGGIVHDFRNMLSVVIGNLDLLHMLIRDNSGACRRLHSALEGAQTCAELTSRLLAFVRRRAIETDVVDVIETVESIMDLLTCALGANIHIRTNYDKDCWPVCVDRPQLEAAIVNLAINARDAMPNGGQLGICVENVCHATDHRDQEASQSREYVRITVSDTGVGMSAEIVEKIFEPFFTTKNASKGSGLGLSMVKHFARQSNGDVTAQSTPGTGTRICLDLPRARLEMPQDIDQDLFDLSA